jgi:hypothetical protein
MDCNIITLDKLTLDNLIYQKYIHILSKDNANNKLRIFLKEIIEIEALKEVIIECYKIQYGKIILKENIDIPNISYILFGDKSWLDDVIMYHIILDISLVDKDKIKVETPINSLVENSKLLSNYIDIVKEFMDKKFLEREQQIKDNLGVE